jgi:hypothetical protein
MKLSRTEFLSALSEFEAHGDSEHAAEDCQVCEWFLNIDLEVLDRVERCTRNRKPTTCLMAGLYLGMTIGRRQFVAELIDLPDV